MRRRALFFGWTVLAAATPGAGADAPDAPRIGPWGVDLDGRNPTVRPQDDFFRHACGAWLDTFVIPEDLPGYGSFTDLFLQSEAQVMAIIERVASHDQAPGSDAQKIADLYNDYIDRERIESMGLDPLTGDLIAIRAAATHQDVARLLGIYARLGGNTPFPYYVNQDPKAPERYIAHFVQGGIGLPDREYYLDEANPRFEKAREARRAYLTTILNIAGDESPAANADHVLALERKLAEAHWPSEATRDVEAIYNKMSPQDLAARAPEFPWDAYFGALDLAAQPEIIVTVPSAYEGMAAAFRATPVAHWQAYLTCALLGSHAQLLPREVDEAQFRFVSEAITGASEQRAIEKRGVQFVSALMGEAVGRLYVEEHFSEASKAQVEALVDNLLLAMEQRVANLDWMSDETKQRAKEKLAKFNVKIGYPDVWRDYSELHVLRGDLIGNARRATYFENERQRRKLGGPVDRNEWLMSPQTVNAYYNEAMNEIVFPAAILQPPFFDPNADPAVNYGGIGAVIGHEIGHGFDDQGRKFDGDGMQRDWWTTEDSERFQVRTDMLIAQYDAYSPLEGMHVNGELTLGENIGDVGGLEIAYHAYRLSLDGAEPPVVDGPTGAQRFFLSYAQIWRGKLRDELMAVLLASNPHSPVEFRVNGAVRNVDAWYEAFGVGEGDAMYLPPAERVRIW